MKQKRSALTRYLAAFHCLLLLWAPQLVAEERDWDNVRAETRESGNYQVVRGDTLWVLARELRPDASASIQQAMLALLRTNPHAFSYANINWLKADEALWMPDETELQALSRSEAYAEVLRQNNFWREMRGRAVSGAEAESAAAAEGAGTTAPTEGKLRVVPVSAADLETGEITDEGAQSEALAQAQAQIEQLSGENVALEDKLFEAETIIEDLRRQIEIKDDELNAARTREMSDDSDQAGSGIAGRLASTVGMWLKSTYGLAREYWYVVLACVALLLVRLLFPRRFTSASREEVVRLASGAPDGTDSGGTAGTEELDNKLDLAQAYIDLDDEGNAFSILSEVLDEGNAEQRKQARQLLKQLNSGPRADEDSRRS